MGSRRQRIGIWHNAHTCAFGITVPKAIGDFLVLEAVYKTNGCAVAISDEDTLKAEALMASVEGAFVCPEGAACMAAAQRLLAEGWIEPDERIVVLNTGCGINPYSICFFASGDTVTRPKENRRSKAKRALTPIPLKEKRRNEYWEIKSTSQSEWQHQPRFPQR